MNGVSVIICCYNSASRLPQTLRYLSRQKTNENLSWEIVLVDNASTDNTTEVAMKLWRDFNKNTIRFVLTNQPIQGLSFARAKGIEVSTYDTLIFCDDDNWLEPNYVQDAYSIMKSDPRIGALGGTGMPVSDSALPIWFDKYKYSFACYAQGDSEGELKNATAALFGAGLTVKREVFVKLEKKKFNPILTDRIKTALASGGDTELCYAIRLIGYKLFFSERLKFSHYLPAARLTLVYLKRLNKSLAYCSRRLIIYHYVLAGKEVTALVWWKDIWNQLIQFSGSLFRFFLLINPFFDRQMDLDFSINTLKGILIQFGTYRSRYIQLVKLQRELENP